MSFWSFVTTKGDDVLTFIALGATSLQQSGLIDSPQAAKWTLEVSLLAAVAHKVFFPGAQPQGASK